MYHGRLLANPTPSSSSCMGCSSADSTADARTASLHSQKPQDTAFSSRKTPSEISQALTAHNSSAQITAEPSQRRSPAWAVGQAFPVVAGRLSFCVFSSHDDAKRRQKEQVTTHYLLTADYHLRYQPFAKDFGPVNLGVLHSFCRFMRKHWDEASRQRKEIIYYSVSTPNLGMHRLQLGRDVVITGWPFAAGVRQCTDKLCLPSISLSCCGARIYTRSGVGALWFNSRPSIRNV